MRRAVAHNNEVDVDIEMAPTSPPSPTKPSGVAFTGTASSKTYVLLAVLFLIVVTFGLFSRSYVSSHRHPDSKNGSVKPQREGPVDPDPDCNFESLKEWALKNGATFKKIYQADFPTEYGKHMRRGVAAGEFIAKDETIVEIPKSLWMTMVSARQSDISPVFAKFPDLDSLDSLILHVMYETKKKRQSFFYPMLCLMPDTVWLPMFYTNSELEEIDEVMKHIIIPVPNGGGEEVKQPLKDKAYQARIFAKSRYNGLMPLMHNQFPQIFPRSEYSVRDYVRALSLVVSRTWGVGQDFAPLYNSTADSMHVMVGLADNFNHNDTSNAAYFAQGSMRVAAHRDTQPGEELFLSYGKKCNAKFLMSYGFVPVGNDAVACPDDHPPPPSSADGEEGGEPSSSSSSSS